MGILEQVRAHLREVDAKEVAMPHRFRAGVEDYGELFDYLQIQRNGWQQLTIGEMRLNKHPIKHITATANVNPRADVFNIMIHAIEPIAVYYGIQRQHPRLPFNSEYFFDHFEGISTMYTTRSEGGLQNFCDPESGYIYYLDLDDRVQNGQLTFQVEGTSHTKDAFVAHINKTAQAMTVLVNAIYEGEDDAKMDRVPSPQTVFFFRPPLQIDNY